MSDQAASRTLNAMGHPERVSIERILDEDGNRRIDVELVLSKDSQVGSAKFSVRFTDSRNIKIGDGRDGIDLGSNFLLSVLDVSRDGWDGVRFKVTNLEQGCPFSLYCRSFESRSE